MLENRDYAIQIHQLSKNYGDKTVVDKLELSVEKGELYSILGPNGAGKTTTIRMLCGLLAPTSGTAFIMGHDIRTELSAVKEVINVSPQETAIGRHLTVRENLLLMGEVYNLSRPEARRRADEMLEAVGLTDRANDISRKLSGGMQRRLSIAMALVSDPQVLFLDEPTLGLDPQARRSLWGKIRSLKGKKTIVLTTHYLEEADALSDRIAIVDRGQTVALGTSAELKRQFSDKQVLTVRVHHAVPAHLEELKKLRYDVTVSDCCIEIGGTDLDYNAILYAILKAGIKIEGISTKETTLDDVFLKLTGEGDVQ